MVSATYHQATWPSPSIRSATVISVLILEFVELRVIFGEDYDGYANFRHRLAESVLSKSSPLLFPQAQKKYLAVLDKLLEINEIYVEGRKTRMMLLCQKAIYLSRSKNQFMAEQLVEDIRSELDAKEDRYLKLAVKYASGHVNLNQNKLDLAAVNFISVISDLYDSSHDIKAKKRFQLLYIGSIYWMAKCHHLKKQYGETTKYCDKLLTFLSSSPEFEGDEECQAYYTAANCMLADIEDRCNKKMDIEHVVRQDAVEKHTGIKLQNVAGYRFYNPTTTVKTLDEFWPEFDKQSTSIRAIGKNICASKYSPYKGSNATSNKVVDYRQRPSQKHAPFKHFDDRTKRENALPCSPPTKVDSHLNDHLVTVGRLTSELKSINSRLAD